VAALTVLYHPDVSRVGDCALFPADGVIEVSRLAPLFGPRGRTAVEPLKDRRLSRTPVRLAVGSGGDVSLARGSGGMALEVDGDPVGDELLVVADRLQAGVVLVLAERVTLLLHRVLAAAPPLPHLDMVGNSDALRSLQTEILRVGTLSVPVLVRGESGVGKELVARAIHRVSARAEQPLEAVNMASIPTSTAASTLFGHARGAFTGAQASHQGLFVRAHTGTLFLDEVGAAPADVQDMLLRVLETQEIRPLGADRSRRVDVRVIAATDADLDRRVDDGEFRLPLLHRLAGYELRVPALRDRRADIARLFVHFVDLQLAETGVGQSTADRCVDGHWMEPTFMAALCRYDWPGNVRELRNVARRLAVAAKSTGPMLATDALWDMLSGSPSEPVAAQARSSSGALTEEALVAALREHSWSIADAARQLGMSRAALYKRLDKCPGVRKATDLSADEVQEAITATDGDIDAMVQRLEVSRRALLRHMRSLGL